MNDSVGALAFAGRPKASSGEPIASFDIEPFDPRANAAALKAAGINSAFHVAPDIAHEFLWWRRNLREFATLFRD